MLDQILIDTSDSIEIDVYYNNVLTDPDSISIRQITDPNGNIILTNQTVVQGGTTGRYEYTLDSQYTGDLGIYEAVWMFVINSVTYEHTQNFEVVSSLYRGYISPYQLREKSLYSKITDIEPTDEVLQKYIDRSTQVIDRYLGDSINYAQYSEEIRCVLDKVHNGVHIQLRHRPVVNLTSVQLMQGPSNTLDLDVDYIRINNEAGYLEYFQDIAAPTLRICIFDPSATNIIPVATVVYTAGYVTVPDSVQEAAIMIVEELYKETMGDDKVLSGFTIDQITERYGNKPVNEQQTVKELGLSGAQSIVKMLRPYSQPFRRGGFAGTLG